jgi:hypothetical protein
MGMNLGRQLLWLREIFREELKCTVLASNASIAEGRKYLHPEGGIYVKPHSIHYP